MYNKFFAHCGTLDEVKTIYRQLAKANHPDKGGTTEVMQEINRQYTAAIHAIASGSNLTADQFNQETQIAEIYREIIQRIIHLPVNIEVVYRWLWITGTKREDTETRRVLKENGFLFAPKKSAWYWRPEDWKTRNRHTMSLEEIRKKYGSEKITRDDKKELRQAS